ncbi:MAG: 6-hydroxymethylpterin diphosphokinase MptE-like protein [Spirochaetia bacterium]
MPKDDLPRVVEEPGGRSIIYGNRHLYSTSDPVERAKLRARGAASAEATLYILASPLLWYGVEELLSTAPPSSHIVAVELDGKLKNISLKELPPRIESHPRFHMIKEENIRSRILTLLYSLGIEKFRKAALISLNGGYRLNSRAYTRIQKLVQEEIYSFWKNKMTLIHMAPLWLKNIFFNIALYHRHMHTRTPSTDKPVLIVGAGPSTEQLLPLLSQREIRALIYIVAVDTALAPLTECGITPDAVVIQEGQFYNVYDFLPLPADSGKDAEGAYGDSRNNNSGSTRSAAAPFYWVDLISTDLIPRLRMEPDPPPRGSCGFFLTSFFPTRLFSRLEKYSLLPAGVPPLGSVGSTAVELTLGHFSGPVYICGLDFSFYYGKSHMRGASQHIRELIITNRFMPVGSLPISFPEKSVYTLKSASPDAISTPKKITTGTMHTYAETFKNRFSSCPRIFAVAHTGADLGIPSISIEDFENEIRTRDCSNTHTGEGSRISGKGSRISGETAGILEDLEDTGERAKAFLQEEFVLLRRVYVEGTKRLSGGQSNARETDETEASGGPPQEPSSSTGALPKESLSLEELVREADYLLHHFPDAGYSVPDTLSPDMIKRLLVSTGHYLKIVERALSLL